ncbi:pyrrolo-quinoline quinone [Terrimonas sp.]|uniref:pyrroloquinoline quinone-dependent dehydrogenase n=1 Tax=Terrimonas sp. TaxID=1914338 RepID=UPI000D51BF62|nr:pyrroloquinoline quinone-dependent dehydrogenase [Terrimonas sp.]PVD54016.1 pyrrolo-quinoline quinone [Terrimonas sp.]
MTKNSIYFLLASILFIISCNDKKSTAANTGWTAYGGNKANNHYSSLAQIDTANTSRLKVAWQFSTGDGDNMTQMQVNPLIIDTTMYIISPRLKLIALHAATGNPIWTYDPVADSAGENRNGKFSFNVYRGTSYYKNDTSQPRLFFSANSKLYCINANTGKPITGFGTNGKIDLHNDLREGAENLYVISTTPGMIYKDMIIVGTRVEEGPIAAPGHIRAYDVHTGKLRWIFHTIPQPGEPGFETWDDTLAYKHIGGANAWAGFSLDEEKGILFSPTGSASFDFYGGKRTGNNLYANCVLALDAGTGKRIWHFQTVHHDVWDRDLPTAPIPVTLTKEGEKIEAVAQVTKSGYVFVLDRATGKPVYPVEEVPVPTETSLTGEKLSPTQPVPTVPKPFVRQVLTENDLNTLVADSSYQDIKKRLASYKTGNMFNAPTKEGTVIFPGFDGGAEWGGSGFDPATGILYVNASEMPWILTMVDVKQKARGTETNQQAARRLYTALCMNCHGADRQGAGNFPAIKNAKEKYTPQQFFSLLTSGRRMMPAFAQLSEAEKQALASFILDEKQNQQKAFVQPPKPEDEYYHLPYNSTGYHKFLTQEGYPAVAPPWGTLNAINLNTGELVWKQVLGDYPELKEKGYHTGTENYGGPVITAGGVLFIAATSDSKFRVFNKATGALLFETNLPAPGFATPATYSINGKQYVVIACGGGKLGKPGGDSYVTFALP